MAQNLSAFSLNRPPSSRTFALATSSSSSSSSSSDAGFGGGGGNGGGDDSDTPLPFPTALPRSDFLAPAFDATAYLSSLMPRRHQTLEDLRADLRERSGAIGAELLELVNANYTAFLGLGDELQGGEERVADVRVALLGFRRAVDEVRARVRARADEARDLNEELRGVRAEVEVGRKMLDLDERTAALEGRLALGSAGADSDESEDEEEEEDDDEDGERAADGMMGTSSAKLTELANEYMTIEQLADDIGREAPFVRKAEERMIRCRNTILLDLNNALKEAKKAGVRGLSKLLKLMGIYALMDAQAEAVKTLKSN